MGADPRLANLPALRKLAEEGARAYHDECCALHRGYAAWDELPAPDESDPDDWEMMRIVGNPRVVFIEARVRLLSDLTRPASRDALARMVAAEWWPDAPLPTTAPHLYWTAEAHDSTDHDGAPNGDGWPEGWWLDNGDGNMHFFSWDDWCPDPDAHTMIVGLKGVTDPAEALTLIAIHVLGSPDATR